MRVLAHPDPVVLERALLSEVAAAADAAPLGRTLVIVPTARLVAHVQRRLAEHRPAWLGVHVMHFRGLAREILSWARAAPPAIASDRLLEALLRRLLQEQPDNRWSAFVERRPRALARVHQALVDLREAGLTPEDVSLACGAAGERALAELYRSYHEKLERSAAAGWVDPAGLIRAAQPHAPGFGRTCRAVFLHGAYELIGAHLDLLQALDRGPGVTALVPASPSAPVSAFAREYAERFLLGPGGALEPLDAPAAGRVDLAALYDEQARPRPAERPAFAFRHAQGTAAEVEIAVREALAAIGDGCPPAEIVLTTRRLEPYAAALEQAFEDHGLPWSTSLAGPLRRQPIVRDFLLLLKVVGEDFPRRPSAELLRSPRLDWRSILPGEPRPPGSLADSYSRQARIVGGLVEWTRDLEAWAARPRFHSGQGEEEQAEAVRRAEERARAARQIGRAAGALDRRVASGSARWSAHAGALERTLEALFHEPEDAPAAAARDELRGLFDEMRRLETFAGDTRDVQFAEMRGWLEEAVDASELALQVEDSGGIRVLDAMQLRGMTFARVHFLGMNGHLFPRAAREDPVLSDRLRARLREQTGRPLPLKARGTQEERLLLSLVLGAARERVDVSWQRADESGRARTPSLALREVTRVARGRPGLEALDEGDAPRHLPSHPTQWLEALLEQPRLLSADDLLLYAALGGESAEALGARRPALGPGLRMLGATQGFTVVDATYDGRVGPPERTEVLSVRALEALGRCPLQFFFEHVLRVRELEEEASAWQIERRELGSDVHAVLERVYRTLAGEGLFERHDVGPLVRRALELLDQERHAILGVAGERLARRLPVLAEHAAGAWLDALGAFARRDLARLAEGGWDAVAFEQPAGAELDFGGERVTVRGRFDRRLEGGRGPVVGDYKTSGELKSKVNVTEMLKAKYLQVPLYSLLAGERTSVELLGVGPHLDPEGGDDRFAFPGFEPEQDRGFRETVGVLVGLWRRGSYPLHKDKHCSWCRYQQACRRNHPPTLDRESAMGDAAAYRLVKRKQAKFPLLALVPRARPDEEES